MMSCNMYSTTLYKKRSVLLCPVLFCTKCSLLLCVLYCSIHKQWLTCMFLPSCAVFSPTLQEMINLSKKTVFLLWSLIIKCECFIGLYLLSASKVLVPPVAPRWPGSSSGWALMRCNVHPTVSHYTKASQSILHNTYSILHTTRSTPLHVTLYTAHCTVYCTLYTAVHTLYFTLKLHNTACPTLQRCMSHSKISINIFAAAVLAGLQW